MCSLERIRELAGEEEEDPYIIQHWVEDKMDKVVTVMDFRTGDIPASLIERYCDDNNIPCHHIATGYVSLATTYSYLLEHEERR